MSASTLARKIVCAAAPLVVAMAASAQGARPPAVDMPVDQLVRTFRQRGTSLAIEVVLRQPPSVVPQAKRKALTDSLVAIAASAPRRSENPAADDLATAAVTALSLAGGQAGSGEPYVGALDALIEIHRTGRSVTLKAHVLNVLTTVPPFSRALDYLREVAASTDSTAEYAIMALGMEATSGGLAHNAEAQRRAARDVLRSLFVGPPLPRRLAAQQLRYYALRAGWIHGSRSRDVQHRGRGGGPECQSNG